MMEKRISILRSTSFLATTLVCCALVPFLMGGCPGGSSGGGGGGGNGDDNTDDDNGNGDVAEKAFVGAADCLACHAESHGDWSETAHAGALESLKAIGQGANAACLPCHTVGFGQTDGFVDEAATPNLAGVQCENCHGAAGEHARDPSDESKRPTVDLSSAHCGGCHTDAHHPTFDEWQLSRHSQALTTLQANAHAQDSCLECHSQDYRFAVEEDEEEVGEEADDGGDDVLPTLQTAQLSIECATCHAPHGGVAQAGQLRKPIADLCGECHTQEEAVIGDTPHHPQLEMSTGTGAYQNDGGPLTVLFSPHATLFSSGGQACAQCHVVKHEVEEPNEGNPNVTGHTFNPFDASITEHQADQYTGCLSCHGTAEIAGGKLTAVQAEIIARLEALAPYFDAANTSFIDPTTLSEANQAKLATAKFDYQFVNADGSRGVHNSFYARAALDAADGIIAELTGP